MRKLWWKIVCIVLLFYVIVNGFMGTVPHLPILNESIRNTYFHVALWLAMTLLLFTSMIFSVRYLNSGDIKHDDIASELAKSGLFYGILGCLTGSLWANFTWGDPWPNDPKLNGAAVGILIYLAYILFTNIASQTMSINGITIGIAAYLILFNNKKPREIRNKPLSFAV